MGMNLNNVTSIKSNCGGVMTDLCLAWRISDSLSTEFFVLNHDCGAKLIKSYGVPANEATNKYPVKELKDSMEVRREARAYYRCTNAEIKELKGKLAEYVKQYSEKAIAALRSRQQSVAS